MRKIRHTAVMAIVGATALASLSGCADTGTTDEGSGDGPVTITVGGLPPTENAASRDAFLALVDQFNEANPDIVVKADETRYDVETFNALLAGGTAPTVINVPMTETQSLIERGQVADLTAYIEESEVLSSIRPEVMRSVTGADGNYYGLPYESYSMGLLYNRAIFEAAGLDPDSPPTTWDEVRAAAKAISENTDAAGYVPMTMNNSGGWALTTMSYALGAGAQEGAGAEAEAIFADTGAMKEALEFYRALRWEDDSMGANFLVDMDASRNAFASGQAGMIIDGADIINDAVTNRGMRVEDYGVTIVPQDADAVGLLGGGAVGIVVSTATEAEAEAAVKWMEFHRFGQYTDQAAAETWAETRVADGMTVSMPLVALLDDSIMDEYATWIEPYVNVPTEHLAPYRSQIGDHEIVPEPAVKGQELYGTLDAVIQAVLTDENADIQALLDQAQTEINQLIAAG